MEKPSYDLIINVFACPTIEKYKNQILKINETWGYTAEKNGVKVLFFFGEEKTDLIGENYIYLPNVKNDHESASWKQYLGFKHIYENYNAKFIFSCGTDTFINIEKILIYLDIFKYDKKLYIGGHISTRNVDNKCINYYSGGSGFIITNKILEELYPQLDYMQNQWRIICENNLIKYLIVACDVSIAYFLANINGVENITNNYFYPCNYLGYPCHINRINIDNIITCHNMSLDDFDNFQKIVENKISNDQFIAENKISNDQLIINNKYLSLCKTPSDINEHLSTLYQLSTECNSVLELGVRGVVSSWSFINGLVSNLSNLDKKLLFLNDIQTCDISELLECTKNLSIEIKYQWINCLDLDFGDYKFDMVFIDTWHVYGQLKRELNKFSKITTKYIVMHDTTVDEYEGETIRCEFNAQQQSEESGIPLEEILKGLKPAIDEFLVNNFDWKIKKKYTNNNGLTILERI
jgi:hypothetical protein